MNFKNAIPLLLAAFSCLGLRAAATIDPARVNAIAAMLAPAPGGFGTSVTNRAAWQAVGAKAACNLLIDDAERAAAKPDPALPDSLYLDYSRTGNRDRGQKVLFERSTRLCTFALAECVEDQGRFLKPLENTIAAICGERSWPYPAHDGDLQVFNGKAMNPDLRATTIAFDLATADELLGGKLSPAIRQLVRDNVRRRVLQPIRDMVEGRMKETRWLRIENNWNAVCLAGTTGAALALLDSPEDRAWYIAAAENYIHYFLRSFTPDGYCSEGVGYWNYGFGRYLVLVESVRLATGGKDDLFLNPAAMQPALFGSRAEIINGMYPTISDCAPGSKPDPQMMRYVAARFDLPAPPAAKILWRANAKNLAEATMLLFQDQAAPPPVMPKAKSEQPSPLRTWFPDGGVLIARPKAEDKAPFAVVLKGGNNAENHNHNDVGSFSVVFGRAMVICDPGGEVYTRRTFSGHRYDSKVLNSYGHAVPIVAGKLQSAGGAARAVVTKTEFTDDQDTVVFDLKSAYAVPSLKRLERTFVYHRAPAALDIIDKVKFEKPERFESALITWGSWKTISTNEIEITGHAESVRVKIDTVGIPFQLHADQIKEDVHTPSQPWHLGITLDAPVAEATVHLTVTPAPR